MQWRPIMAKRSQRPNISKKPPANLNRLALIVRPISELKLDPNNAKKHPPHQVKQLAESMRVFGFNAPILIDEKSRVISGHGRVLAARSLGLADLPTICLSHLRGRPKNKLSDSRGL
jgi:hypothetical protein